MIALIFTHIILSHWFGTKYQSCINNPGAMEISLSEFRKKRHSYCDTFNYEITDIYGDDDTCSVEPIWLYLDNDLKENGFKVTHFSRGNWQCGWRFVQMTLEKDTCKCTVTKKHWSEEYTVDNKIHITEQISCNHPGPINFFLGD